MGQPFLHTVKFLVLRCWGHFSACKTHPQYARPGPEG